MKEKIIKPAQLRNLVFDTIRRNHADCEVDLDNPTTKTAVTRIFKLDFLAKGTYEVDSVEYTHLTTIVLRFLDECSTNLPNDADLKHADMYGFKTLIGLGFGIGDFCTETCGQIHFDIFNSSECRLKKGGKKLDDEFKHTEPQMRFLLIYFNAYLHDEADGCKVCSDKSKKKKDLPKKVFDEKKLQTLKEQFEKLHKHCTDNHSQMTNFLYGLALVNFPEELDVKIPDLKIERIKDALLAHSSKVGKSENTGCDMKFQEPTRFLTMRTAGTAQQKMKAYFFYDGNWYIDSDGTNYLSAASLFSAMREEKFLGKLLYDVKKCSVQASRITALQHLEKVVGGKKIEKQNMKKDLKKAQDDVKDKNH